jgi:hypothetical protein
VEALRTGVEQAPPEAGSVPGGLVHFLRFEDVLVHAAPLRLSERGES